MAGIPVQPSAAAFDALSALAIFVPTSGAILLGAGFSGGKFILQPSGGFIDESRRTIGKLALGRTDEIVNRLL
ncbi:MAG: hypothetical protein O7E57_13700 [Gammaproteobacteria bacterium]|nr:hypothetical protein [Gammaproteobacteria bacterium]